MAEPMGFYTDTTVCIGCKACEVACKEWNQLPSTNGGVNTLSGDSYDNTRRLDGIHWRHVKFIEQFTEDPQGRPLALDERRLQALRPCGLPRSVSDGRDRHEPNSTPSSFSRTPATVVETAFRPVLSASSISIRSRAPPKSARSAMIGCRAGWSRRAPRPARPSRSSSERSTSCVIERKNGWSNYTKPARREHISTARMKKCWAA